jgi:hypothetical protein
MPISAIVWLRAPVLAGRCARLLCREVNVVHRRPLAPKKAKALLADNSMPLSEVALEVGFADQSHFRLREHQVQLNHVLNRDREPSLNPPPPQNRTRVPSGRAEPDDQSLGDHRECSIQS